MGNKLFTRKNLLMLIDIVIFFGAYLASYAVTLNTEQFLYYLPTFKQSFLLVVIVYTAVFYFTKIYEQLWRYADVKEYQLCAVASLIAGGIFVVTGEIAGYNVPIRIQGISPLISMTLIISSRIVYKLIVQRERTQKQKQGEIASAVKTTKHRLAIVGAGDAGVQLLREIRNNVSLKYDPICFVDDSFQKVGRSILGIDIEGPIADIKEIILRNKIEDIIIVIPSALPADKKRIIELCTATGCKVRILPGIPYMLKSSDGEAEAGFSDKIELMGRLRNIEVEDLLSRDVVKIDDEDISNYIKGKTVLVTGGGGSIGSEICRQAVSYGVKNLIILDSYENNAYDIEQELKRDYKFVPSVEIITVREYETLDKFFYEYSTKYGKIDVVFHAAAHKHVPLMEHNPEQAVKNNIFGTYNIARLCDKYSVDRMVLISTDKAVNPTNVMGASKHVCEMIMQVMNQDSKTIYTAVRFGNVLGSNGSVIPLFKKQIEKGGPVTVTHPDIIRYFMTIPEAVSLVLNAGGIANGGEIFVLDMGEPVKIFELAKNMIRLAGLRLGEDIDIEFTGLRPGEKLFEELLMAEEGLSTTKSEKIFVGRLLDIEQEVLFGWISNLYSNVDSYSRDDVINKLKEIVPNFTSQRVNK